jgi:hypothetical protein
MSTTVRRFLPVALTAAFISACADAPTSTVRFSPTLPSQHLVPIATPELEFVALCKAGPVGTYTFDATATHAVLRDATTGNYSLTAATYTIVVSAGSTIDVGGTTVPGACYSFSNTRGTHNHIALAGGTIDATVTVVETGIPAGIDFDHVVVYQLNSGTVSSSSSTTNSASGRLGGTVAQPATLGANIVFYNVTEPPPPPPPAICDFITFGRLVWENAGQKVVISGNAGGNSPHGGFLNEFHIEVNGVDHHVADITSYGPIAAAPLASSAFTNSRHAAGLDKHGHAVELRVWDGGEPGWKFDRFWFNVNGTIVGNATNGNLISQGNMQYHANCRGPGN